MFTRLYINILFSCKNQIIFNYLRKNIYLIILKNTTFLLLMYKNGT